MTIKEFNSIKIIKVVNFINSLIITNIDIDFNEFIMNMVNIIVE